MTTPHAGTTHLGSVVLPAFNEEAALPGVLDEIRAVLGDGYEVLVVDDGSGDRTAEVAAAHGARVVRHETNLGKGAAMRTGAAAAGTDRIVFMDADGTYPASAIPEIIRLLDDHDLVRCRRERDAASMKTVNRIGNRVIDTLLAATHGLRGGDHLTGLYGIRREALLTMDTRADGFDIEVEIGIKAKAHELRETSFPVEYRPRVGETKLHPVRDGWAIVRRVGSMVLVHNPFLAFVVPGILVFLVAFAFAVLLGRGPVQTPFFGLDIHSFIVATLGVLAGFQLVGFGVAVALYRFELGFRPRRWLVAIASRPVRLGGGIVGAILALTGLSVLAVTGIAWIAGGAGAFTATRRVVMAATALVFGLQVLSTSWFLSIFAGRIAPDRER